MSSITSSSSSSIFKRLVQVLKQKKKTITVIESCCGGLINASILSQPGASSVYFGGSVAYNTRRAKPFLLNNEQLHSTLEHPFLSDDNLQNEKDKYIQSKLHWTRTAAEAFCREVGTDYCIAEGGAAGPTFRPKGMTTGFAVIAVAAAKNNDQSDIDIVKQEVIYSTHADREANMRLYADAAAKLVLGVIDDNGENEEDLSGSTVSTSHLEKKKKKHQILDRATHLRSNSEVLDKMAAEAKYVVLHENMTLFRDDSTLLSGGDPTNELDQQHQRELAFLSKSQIDRVSKETGMKQQTSFLGLLDGHEPVFGVDMVGEDDGGGDEDDKSFEDVTVRIASEQTEYDDNTCRFEDTRTVAPLLLPNTPSHNELALHATALAQWQRRNKFCSACGSGSTVLLDGGTSLQCTSCGHRSWPRQDPSMIAVVSSRDGSRALLGRSRRHPPKLYTALAGFVEAGETMERAVAREVFEETGVRIDEDTVRYVASQPWPFPQSTMLGFTATADDTNQTLNIDDDELVDAAWFDKSQVLSATKVPGPVMQHDAAMAAIEENPNLELLIPPRGVLARRLIDTWLGVKCH